jgi:hypothetical protein
MIARRLQIYAGPPSTIRQLPKSPLADLSLIRAGIGELEAESSNSQRIFADNTVENDPVHEAHQLRAHRPRGHAILALEAGLLEMRTARSLGLGRVPRGSNQNSSSTRSGRRANARLGPAGLTADQILGRGSRYERREPLTQDTLWESGARPPEQYAYREHHKCGICHMVKSHPVS